MKQRPYILAAALVALLVAIAAGGLYLASLRSAEPSLRTETLPAASEPALTAASPSAPRVQHPIESVGVPASAPAESTALESRLIALFGRQDVVSRLQLDGFLQRIVATVDNLPREHGAARLWPVTPADRRFQVQKVNGQQVINPDNGLRYTPYVLMLERVDLPQLAALYKQLYPSFQAAYEELGYPGSYFNDRVVAVIDHLLAAPEHEGLVRVHLPEFTGPVQPARPWVMYQFDDPALEGMSSGHKIMLRMGQTNERRVKARLRELRPLLATASPGTASAPAN